MLTIQNHIILNVFDFKLLFKILHYVKPYKLLFIGTIFISIFFGCMSTIRPLLIQYAFDNYILNLDIQGLLNIILVIFILLLIEAYCQFLFIYRSNYLAQKIIKNLRVETFDRIIHFQVSYFDKTPTGQLITRVISDMESISAIFSQGLLLIFGDIFKMILIIICMFFVSWELTLISLLFLPFLIISTIIFQKYMKRAFIDVRKYISRINVFVYEHIIGMNIVQIFAQEKQKFEEFKKINSLHRDAHIKTILYFSIFLPIVDVLSAIAMGLLVWYGAFNIVSGGTITIGEIVAFILFINMLFRPLRAIADRFNVLQMGVVAASRVFDILERNMEEVEEEVFFKKMKSGSLLFKNISFSYKENEPVLKNISFEVKKCETLAIVGPTGTGKTTIINLLMRWYPLNDGDIWVNNINIKDLPLSILRKNIGVVLQNTFFLSDTLMNNIKFFNDVSNEKVYKVVEELGLKDFIYKFPENYNYYIGERGSGLSEGEKQLISFLRTYLLNPSFLILDEATSSMDPITENLLQNAIKNIIKDRTSIIIAHRLSTIKNVDKIIVLYDGCIVESGTHQELLALNGKYTEYYHQQFVNT